MTASAHPLVFRPLVELLHARGDEVEITARQYAPDPAADREPRDDRDADRPPRRAVAARQGAADDARGSGRSTAGRAGANFDVALAHGSHELTITARRLGIPSATTFDYEWAWLQHQLGCRAATRVVVPDSIPDRPPRALRRGAAQAAPVSGPEGGVLPRRLRARPGRTRAVGYRPRADAGRDCGRHRTSRCTTGTRTRSSR